MKESEYVAICKFMHGVWGYELSPAQKQAGWALLHDMPDEAVGEAVTRIANEGGDRMPAWALVLKTARSLADAQRDKLPALPAGDTLSDDEHRGAMIRLQAKNSPESARRVKRCEAIKQLPRERWMSVLMRVRTGATERLPAPLWDAFFDQVMREERQKTGTLEVV